MNELKDELYAIPMLEWRHVPFTANHHKWWLTLYRLGDDGNFLFYFESPRKRKYFFWAERGETRGRVTDAEVTAANGDTIDDYRQIRGDNPERLGAVIRLTPKHVLDRLFRLLDAIG